MELAFLIKPCPWCKRTPKFTIPVDEPGTWNAFLGCAYRDCKIHPATKIIGIRRTSKTIFARFRDKICLMVASWNTGNSLLPYEATLIDLSRIEGNFIDFDTFAKEGKWIVEDRFYVYSGLSNEGLMERTKAIYYDK